MENLELMIDAAIDDCAEKYKSSVIDVIEAIYGDSSARTRLRK